jgi:hypothetical protein
VNFRFGFDLLLMALVSLAAGFREPLLGVICASLSLVFLAQHWRTVLLVGQEKRVIAPKRLAMASILAATTLSVLVPFLETSFESSQSSSALLLWVDDLLPLWIGIGLIAVLGLLHLTLEKTQR